MWILLSPSYLLPSLYSPLLFRFYQEPPSTNSNSPSNHLSLQINMGSIVFDDCFESHQIENLELEDYSPNSELV